MEMNKENPFGDRLESLAKAVRRRRLDAMLVFGEANIRSLTGVSCDNGCLVVRPASAFGVACGKWLALCAASAAALALSAALTAWRLSDAPRCMHHHQPRLPAVEDCAREALAAYLADPATPDVVKKAPKSAVLSLLANKESALVVRARFATQLEMRAPFEGRFSFAGREAAVSHSTQSSLDVPLVASTNDASAAGLAFANTGKETVMLRPRRDLELLSPADAFAWNLARATLQMASVVALLAAFGTFLSAAVSRPVAIFTAFVALAAALMAPSVVAQFPDELDVSLMDRFGLAVSRAICFLTSAVGESEPVSDLAGDVCIEWAALARSLAVNVLALPAALLAATAAIVRRRPLAGGQ